MSKTRQSPNPDMPNFLIGADLKENMDNYLGGLGEGKVKSLQELVDWNFAHAEEALTEGMIAP